MGSPSGSARTGGPRLLQADKIIVREADDNRIFARRLRLRVEETERHRVMGLAASPALASTPATERLSAYKPREVTHLAAGPSLRLAVEVDEDSRLGEQAFRPTDVIANQVFHHTV